jgi:type III pantothenate kinase
MQSAAEACGVRNGYVQPELLGVDRWLGLLAARSRRPAAACIVGVGTALTVDLLDADGQHHGGLLVPGPELMMDALVTRTARIGAAARQAEPQVKAGLGVNTAGAMQEGGLLAAAALAVRAAQDFAERNGAPVWLCLTGGGAETVAERLPTNAPWPVGIAGIAVQPDLVLQGLAVMAAASRDGLRHY